MSLPRSDDARLFCRAAFQRFDDAQLLLAHGRTTGAAYLAGYGVECILKALILSVVSKKDRLGTVQMFRGRKAHDLEWLRILYVRKGRTGLPRAIAKSLTRIAIWSTNLRYSPVTIKKEVATSFLNTATDVMRWADGRI